MTAKRKEVNKRPTKPGGTTKKPHTKSKKQKSDLFDRLDRFFDKRLKLFMFLSLIITVIVGFLLFDMRVSLSGDDAGYIVKAYQFIHDFELPGYQGPLYPIVLSLVVLFSGINLFLLKFLSFVFIVIHNYLLYIILKNKIPSTITVFVLFMSAINCYLLFYASQTYSEAFFMLLQNLFILFFVKFFISSENRSLKFYKEYLIIGFLLICLGMTRSVGYGAVIAAIGYFIFTVKWKNALYTIGSFSLFMVLYEGIKKLTWGGAGFQLTNQGSGLMLKDFYHPQKGNEDFIGFLNRFIDNSNLYLSKHLFRFLGLRPENTVTIEPVLTVLVYALFIITFILILKKNRFLLFSGIYLGIMYAVSFFSLQKHWDQDRIVIIFLSLSIMFLFSGLYHILKFKTLRKLQIILPILMVVLLFLSFGVTNKKLKHTKHALSEILSGNEYFGYSPDWVNYFKMSKWAANNIPDSVNIASRKPTISFIHADGRKFYGIYRVHSSDINNFKKIFKDTSEKFMLINPNGLNTKKLPPQLIINIKRQTVGYIMGKFSKNSPYGEKPFTYNIFRVTPEHWDPTISILQKAAIMHEQNIDSVLTAVKKHSSVYSIIEPDSLLKPLKENNVRYVIIASLRKNPNKKTKHTINTVSRYFSWIENKYPGILKKIYQIGADNNEPARLFEIKYKPKNNNTENQRR